MASSDPERLRNRLRNTSFDGSPEVLRTLQDEARRTVDQQVMTLNDIDSKASRILRINVVLGGLLVTGLSYVSQTDGIEVSAFENLHFGVGISGVLLSSALAGLTYSASEVDGGVGADNLASTLNSGVDANLFSEFLLKNYAMRINFNRSTNVRNAPLITTTILCLVTGLGFLAFGTYRAFYGSIPALWTGLFLLMLCGYAWMAGLPGQTKTALVDVYRHR